MDTPRFPKRDPGGAEFWDLRYAAGFAPWDARRVPQRLRSFIAAQAGPRRVLVPGCGSGHDVRCFAEAGWEVTGLDFSAAALEAARPVVGPFAQRLVLGDFFAPIAGEPFEVVYERAFLCALPRRLWDAWSRRVARLVVPGGLLAGFFYFETGERGPPFGLATPRELDALLEDAFERIEDAAVDDSIEVFQGRERWQVWRRRAG